MCLGETNHKRPVMFLSETHMALVFFYETRDDVYVVIVYYLPNLVALFDRERRCSYSIGIFMHVNLHSFIPLYESVEFGLIYCYRFQGTIPV